jgi:hypothetical protein
VEKEMRLVGVVHQALMTAVEMAARLLLAVEAQVDILAMAEIKVLTVLAAVVAAVVAGVDQYFLAAEAAA